MLISNCMKEKLKCVFTSDLHGSRTKYNRFFLYLEKVLPDAVFIGGDLSGSIKSRTIGDNNSFPYYLFESLKELKDTLQGSFPEIFLILGNDDSRNLEADLLKMEKSGLCCYLNEKHCKWQGYDIFGYSYVPPTPFLFKDWERYDVSIYVDPGSIPPEAGISSIDKNIAEDKYRTIKIDLENHAKYIDFGKSICLFHSPPYKTQLDRGDVDGRKIDGVPMDVHLGSIAIYDFIYKYQPSVTLHGHIHESTRMTGNWKDVIGCTYSFNGAHDGTELCVITFNPAEPGSAGRELI
jgi:uncharacterized protein